MAKYLYKVNINQIDTINEIYEEIYSNFEIDSIDLLYRIFMFKPNGKYTVTIIDTETNRTLECKVLVFNKSVQKLED